MKISYNWLKDYIDLKLSPYEVEEKLTLAGLEVEEMVENGFKLENVYVGNVTSCEQHPDADKLKVCMVDYGADDEVQVVCGAPNVAEGQKVPFAAIGTVFPNGLKIKKAKLRGVESSGMICALDELGISDDHSGIWVLDENAQVGTTLIEYLEDKSDYIFDISITPNRPDCLSHIGVVREIAALTREEIKYPKSEVIEISDLNEKAVKVNIITEEGCPRYACRIIKDVKITESPQWLKEKLEAVGVRPINNVVDITNFVLMEYGHPLHAFDYNKISGKEINVRYSNPEEEFTTLDGITHKLPEKSVMICDAEKAVALGGIMGGANSEVMDDTTDVLLEAAYFNPGRINKTAKTLRINTEASHRFERGVDPNGIENAMERTASLIQQLTGGKLLKGIVDQYPSPIQPFEITVDRKMINKIIGIDFTIEQMEKLLKSINIKIEDDKFIIPTFRPDIKISADIAEEVARIYGYDNIPAREITEMNYGIHYNEYDDFIDGLKVDMAGMEMYEVISNSMGKKELFESVTGIESMGIVNPVSRDLTGLRTSLIPSMLEIVKNNVNRQNKDLRLFEINNIYIPSKVKTEPPLQERHLCVAISGRRYPLHWGVNNEPVDFYDIKGITEDILAKISLDNYGLFYYDNFIGAGENLAVKINDEIAGFMAVVDDNLLDKFDIKQKVYVLNLNIDILFKNIKKEKKYMAVPKYPGTERDVAFILKKDQGVEEIFQFIYKNGGNFLKNVVIFDRFLGKALEKDEQSLAFKLIFQSDKKTLTDKEVNKTFNNIIDKTTKKFEAKLRN